MSVGNASSNKDVMKEAWIIATTYEQQMQDMTSGERVQFLVGSLAGSIASHNHLVDVVSDMRRAMAEHAQVLVGLVMKRAAGSAA